MSTCSRICANALLLTLLLGAGAAHAEPEKAKPADSYVDGIGVNTHLLFSNYIDNLDTAILPRMQEIGIRNIRDGILLDDEPFKARIRALGAFGVKATFITRPPQFAGLIPWVKEMAPFISVLEGPNEPHNEPTTYKGLTGMAALKPYQQDLYAAVRADPDLAKILVASPGIDWFPAYTSVGDLDAWCDLGNFHHWPPSTGETPYTATAPTDGLYRGPGSNPNTGLLKLARTITSTKPLIATETGWSTTQVKPTADHGWDPGVSDAAASKYSMRVTLELFNNGVRRYFIYELIDDYLIQVDVKQHMGLIARDGSLKADALAIKNMISLLGDPGADFTLGSLDYSLSAAGIAVVDDQNFKTGEIHHTLLQKRDGTFYLVLWNEIVSYDNAAERDINVPEQTVTLKLTTPIHLAKTFLPLNGAAATASFNDPTEITLKVPDHPLVVELTPPGVVSGGPDAGNTAPVMTTDAATGGAGGSGSVIVGAGGSNLGSSGASVASDSHPTAAPTAASPMANDDAGCSCRQVRSEPAHHYEVWLLAALAALLGRRQSRTLKASTFR